MHLFAAQPGSFGDQDGIIDLGQSPADIVILAAADSLLAALADAVDERTQATPSVRLANWLNLTKPASLDLYRTKVLDHARVVVVSLLGGQSYWHYGLDQLRDWQSARPERHLILVPGDDQADPDLMTLSSTEHHETERMWRYFREGGATNAQRALDFLVHRFFDDTQAVAAPQCLPKALIYAPERLEGITVDHWLEQADPQCDNALLIFYRSHLQAVNTALFDTLIALALEHGINLLPLAVTSLKDTHCLSLANQLCHTINARLILNTTGFALSGTGNASLASQPRDDAPAFEADVPVLQAILSSSSRNDWQDNTQGLRSRDIAMQVALPEIDGRITTRALAFKHIERRSQHAQIDVIRFALDDGRARFVMRLAQRWIRLGRRTNADKRVALVLANYPTREGRIGNGVGLDTPASAHALLNALERAGYTLDDLPDDGNALIERLKDGITNDLDTLPGRPCFQSVSLERYLIYFNALPEPLQQAVSARWGLPERDPKYRSGRLMIAGRRFGHVFVGLQPARGFDIDLDANYHDPDLVPPHAYLAFYAWLTEIWNADAVVHVGKHGNLEWLPGKGLALSEHCWPEAAFAPLPHFYPFIVNDPGEGAQAKRRTQAVIIDHLMPPMARAELYGPMIELEELADEYYQALGMDDTRAEHLKAALLDKARESHLMEELGPSDNDDESLVALDGYLCELKEAQIRNGLHCLGRLPEGAEFEETLVALLRLPRGERAEDRGLLHALAIDLGLPEAFDPLSQEVTPWQGPYPDILAELSDAPWRTHQDTRERLEQLARRVVGALSTEERSSLKRSDWPATTALLDFIDTHLGPALDASAHNELNALVQGLNGRFVRPGPSGAPTRGRLDTLPTGRNFFSVDSRAIPSKMAWTLGQRSADRLIERHLQEHGDYPRTLGLSVWGTATMRTGGDDIAQALALMGVKPRWAAGSQRVVGFEIIPGFILNRPRVDVTLRVSGLFRDAFPNLMQLIDAAVRKLADFEEPLELNTIRANVLERTTALGATLTAEQAHEQARYRVFGTRPGAYGAGLQGLIDERLWDSRDDLTEAYLNWGGYAYGEHDHGTPARQAFAHQLGNLEAVVQNQDNREHDLLDSDDYYQFQGGMTNAVTTLSGYAPSVYHGDHSHPHAPRIRTLKEELNRVLRSRALNPKWQQAMRRHGYKGAFEMAATVDYLFAFDATTALIDDYQYENVTDSLILDPDNRAFLEHNNLDALKEMSERLLEACQRGLWAQPGNYQDTLEALLLEIDAKQEHSR
ncbi:cobaltochelatase subunit CobN [Larsenimonas salina]|uniref:cobaltochelatase subunit CobN n=1 Tax=Larsenimonas salina TaxID=1295565 RepID=UPI0020742A0B|nr:cobaltochelatase subunit CobN [Larsenimonas salina]MCM5703659.1 cobaltochelatase subunit CobN [Larsenimonas salina]